MVLTNVFCSSLLTPPESVSIPTHKQHVCHVTIWTLSLFGPRPKQFINVIRYCNVSYLRLELIGECCSNAGSLASANMAAKVSFTLASIPLLINDNVAAKTTKQV